MQNKDGGVMRHFAKGIVHLRYVMLILFVAAAAVCVWAMGEVHTNYDIVSYLPEDSDTVQTLDKMEEQFGAVGTAQVIVKIDASEVSGLKKKLESIKGMQAVVASGTDEASYKDGYALFKLFLTDSSFSPEAHDTINAVRKALGGYEIAMNGGAVSSTFLQEAVVSDMVKIMVVACIVIAIILLITSTSWIDPVVFAIVVAVSLLINLGTNAILTQVSFITKAICAIMQLALAMDYSIILLHRFNEERERTLSIREAMVNAIAGSFTSVAASSLTTIAGLVALMFMRFTIGMDVGIVLTKGIVISLLSVFLFMPGIIMIFAPLIQKTKHRTLQQVIGDKMEASHAKKQIQYDQASAESGKKPKKAMTYVDFMFKARKIIPLLVLALLVGGAVMNFNVKYTYQLETSKNPEDAVNVEDKKIESLFGKQNSLVVLVPTGNFEKERELVDFMANYQYNGKNVVNGAQGMVALGFDTAIPIETVRSILEDKDVDEFLEMAGLPKDAEFVMIYDLLKLLNKAELTNDILMNTEMRYLSGILKRALQAALPVLEAVKDGDVFTADQLALFLTDALEPLTTKIEVPASLIGALYTAAGFDPATAVSAEELITAVNEKGLVDKLFPDGGTIPDLLNKVLGAAVPLIPKLDVKMTPEDFGELLSNPALSSRLSLLFNSYGVKTASVYNLIEMLAEVVPEGSDAKPNTATSSVARASVLNLILPTVNLAFTMFESGNGMSRLMFNLDMETANDDSFAAMKEITEGVRAIYGDENVYIACETAAYADIKDNFQRDSMTINLISFFAILLIILISFRSFGVPVILTILIQGATWLGMAMQFMAGNSVFFVCYLVVMCIQMGATVDYAILITNRYVENRFKMNRIDAMKDAFGSSVMTVLTSGSILVIAAFIVGMVSKVAIIADLGVMLSIGCLISLCIILFGLPAILFVTDKFIEKTTIRKNGKRFIKDGEEAAPAPAAETASEDQAFLRSGEFVPGEEVEYVVTEDPADRKFCGLDEAEDDE